MAQKGVLKNQEGGNKEKKATVYEKAHMAVGKSVHFGGPERKANQTSAENCIPPYPPREKLDRER